MPSADVYRRMFSGVRVADMLAHNADRDMEMTWDEDIQSKKCYIYDYYHDDQPHLAEGMSYDETTKTPIDAKFIVTEYGSISKDQVEFHIMFRPSQQLEFEYYEDLYYYETDYRGKYGASFPIGLYIDIPDEKGKYHKWLICDKDFGNQFIKYSVLPCEYYAMWIENEGDKRIKRKMWCINRDFSMNDSDGTVFTYALNQSALWFPLNTITEKLFYTHVHKTPQRLVVSALTTSPLVWTIDSVNNINPIGIYKIVLKQDEWNADTDYVNFETKEMFADYYSSSVAPVSEEVESTIGNLRCVVSAGNNILKAGGSYKLLTVNIYDADNNDVTEDYMSTFTLSNWSFKINNITAGELISVKTQTETNKIRIKFADDKSYLSQVLNVKFETTIQGTKISDTLPLEIGAV